MSIVSYNVITPGQVGIAPRIVQIVSTDSLSTITTAGYLNKQGQVLEGISILPTDEIHMIYLYVKSTNSGTFGIFLSTFSSGVITLSLWANPGDVLLPVVSGNFSVFNGTTGQTKDAGYLPSNAAKTVVAMANGTVVSGNLVKFADTAGTVADQGVAFKSVAGAAAAGGAAAQSFTDAFCTSGSCVVGNWNTQANAASVLKIIPGTGSFVVTSSADAGVGTFNYIITK